MMNKLLKITALLLAALLWNNAAHAALEVLACEPEWGALVSELVGDKAKVNVATTARQDPHRIEARPSLIARARRADLLVCTGAELEIGWLPLLQRESGNARIQRGQPGYFEAASYVTLIEKPERLDRAMGDVHASGNPHLHTDPRNLPAVAEALATRLGQLDPANVAYYSARLADFKQRWTTALQGWESRAKPLRGMKVVVQHKSWSYLIRWLGLEVVADLEPQAGVAPSAAHLAEVATQLAQHPARLVLRTNYQSARPAQWLAQHTTIQIVELPFTVGATEQAGDLFGLFDEIVNRLVEVSR